MKKIVLMVAACGLAGCWSEDQTNMMICATKGRESCIEKFIADGVDVNGHGKEGGSPFYGAIRSHNFKVADIFLKHGVDINGVSEGKSFVDNAVADSDVDALVYLGAAGAELKKESSAYKLALQKGDKAVIALFK